MFRLKVREHFDAAHYIKDYKGKCSREHGHRWEVGAVLEGDELNSMNMLIDFAKVKDILGGLIDTSLDHYQLNDSIGEANVTAEFLAQWLYRQLKDLFEPEVQLVSITVWESPDCCVEYSEESSIKLEKESLWDRKIFAEVK